jgi:hypothetical protein
LIIDIIRFDEFKILFYYNLVMMYMVESWVYNLLFDTKKIITYENNFDS